MSSSTSLTGTFSWEKRPLSAVQCLWWVVEGHAPSVCQARCPSVASVSPAHRAWHTHGQ